MKRANNLIEKIIDIKNIKLAFCLAKSGKTDKNEVISFQRNLDEELLNIRKELCFGLVNIGNYHYFKIYDPKVRNICASSFSERVIHHAIMRICEHIFEKKSYYHSYACRKGKGGQMAVKKAQEYARQNKYFLKMDIKKYFDTIDHTILIKLLEKTFKEKLLIQHFQRIIATYHTAKGKGMPIGNLTSQYFANYYLTVLDRFITETLKIRYYLRYMDDFIVWNNDKDRLKQILCSVRQYADEKLDLVLRENSLLNKVEAGMNFLGYRIFPYYIRLTKTSKRRFLKKIKLYYNNYFNNIWDERELAAHLEPLVNFIQFGQTLNFRKRALLPYETVLN